MSTNTHSLSLVAASTQYAETASAVVNLQITGDMSIEFWMKPTSSLTGGDERGIISKASAVKDCYQITYRDIGDPDPQLAFYTSSNASGGTVWNIQGTETPFVNNSWVHIAVTYKASIGQIRIYKNGSLIDVETTSNTDIFSSGVALALGRDQSTATKFFDGLLNDVRVWSETRSASDISTNYMQQLTGSETNLQGYWKLNNNYVDSSPNNYDLTAHGSPTFSTDVPFTGLPATSTGSLLLMGIGS